MLCTDFHVRVAVWPLVITEGVALKKVITAEGVTVTATVCSVGLVPVAPEHRRVYLVLAVNAGVVVQLRAVPTAILGVVVPGTAGVAVVEMTPDVAVVSYRTQAVASDDVHAIAVVELNSMVVGVAVRDVIAGDAATVSGVVAAATVSELPLPPPPPPHEARPESASSKTKCAPAKWGVAWVVLWSAMLLPDPNNAILGG